MPLGSFVNFDIVEEKISVGHYKLPILKYEELNQEDSCFVRPRSHDSSPGTSNRVPRSQFLIPSSGKGTRASWRNGWFCSWAKKCTR